MENESGSWTQYQKLVLRLLEQHDEKLEELRVKLSDSKQDRVYLKESLSSMKEDIVILFQLVRDGTPHVSSTLSRVDHLEADVKDFKDKEVVREKEKSDLQSYKRALFIAIIGVMASTGWEILHMLLGK